MLTSKETSLKTLLESENGVHLTAYLVNRGDLIDLKSQLVTVINEPHEPPVSGSSFMLLVEDTTE